MPNYTSPTLILKRIAIASAVCLPTITGAYICGHRLLASESILEAVEPAAEPTKEVQDSPIPFRKPAFEQPSSGSMA